MDIENEMKSQPIATIETPAEIPNSSNNTLYQSILAEPLLTTVQSITSLQARSGVARSTANGGHSKSLRPRNPSRHGDCPTGKYQRDGDWHLCPPHRSPCTGQI